MLLGGRGWDDGDPADPFAVLDGPWAPLEVDVTLAEEEKRRTFEDEALADLQQNREERKLYASRIYFLTVGYLVAVGTVLWAQGTGAPRGQFWLSDNVLIAMLGGTTVTVVSILIIVAKHLFPERRQEGEKPEPGS